MKRRSFNSALITGLGTSALLGLSGHARAADKPATIRIGFSNAGSGGRPLSSGTYAASAAMLGDIEKEFAADGVKIEYKYFVGAGPATNENFANGLLDLCFSHGDLPFLVGNSTGLKRKAILSNSRGGDVHFIGPASTTAKSPLDIKGKTLSVQKGTAGQLTLYRVLEKFGITDPEKEFRIISQIKDDQRASLATGNIAGSVDSPFGLEARGVAKRIVSLYDDPLLSSPGTIWVGEAFEAQHPDIVQRIVTALVKRAHWSTLEANRETQYQLWTRSGNDTYLDNKENWGRVKDLRTRINPLLDDYYVGGLQKAVGEMKKYRLLRREVNMDFIERKYLNHALAELKLENYWPTQDAQGKFIRT